MNMSNRWLLGSVFLLSLLAFSVHAEISEYEDEIEGLEGLEINLDQINALEENMVFRLTAPDIAFFLEKIPAPLWKSTAAPAGRDILYLLPYKITAVEYGGFAGSYFFNMTNRMNVTVNDLFNYQSTLTQQEFLQVIGSYLEGASIQQVEQLLPLFQKITIQERKTGFLLQGGATKGPFTLQLHTSLQLGARNFWLNDKDADAIRAVLKEQFGESELDEGEFYIIRIGMGDTRIKFGLNTINMTSFQNDVGFEAIVPTSRLSYVPRVNIGVAETSFDEDDMFESGVSALRGVRDYLINPRLGNNGHFGFGCYWETKVGLFHDLIQLWTRASYDVLFPCMEDRIFMFKTTLTPEDMKRVNDSGMDTPENQALVNQYIQQYVFPSSFKANVYPGGVANIVIAANVDFSKRWRGALGYDFYAQRKENIREIYNTSVNINDLRVDDAETQSTRQHKIFSEVFYHNKKNKSDCGIGIGGDVTVANVNIGADWTVYLKFASSF